MDPVRIVTILIALGLVIFVHELGHFLVARWAGVLVERFSIGFGPVLLSFRRKETEYAISAIPLGGYVKMLGQTDTPEVEEPSDDERSYQNKPVGKRMAIIAAGVIMNVIFGFVCFAIAFHLGVPIAPAIIGTAIPGKPAWEAGMRTGDEVVAINGNSPIDFEELMRTVALTHPPNDVLQFEIDRQGSRLTIPVAPRQEEMKPLIGVLLGPRLQLDEQFPFEEHSPAARANNPGFEGRDTIRAVDGEPVATYFQYLEKSFAKQDQPIVVTVERRGRTGSGAIADITLEPNYVRHLGVTMQISEVVAVQANSPALRGVDADGNVAQIQPKDVIRAVDGVEDLDPMRLPDLITQKAGQEVELTLLRPGKLTKPIKLKVVPQKTPTWIDFPGINGDEPLSIPGLGIAYRVLPTVVKVTPGFPAADAEIPLAPGDEIKAITLDFESAGKSIQQTHELKTKYEWPNIFWAMQHAELRKIKLTVERAGQRFEVALEPKTDESWPIHRRGLQFLPAQEQFQAASLGQALAAGLKRTRAQITTLFEFLHGLVIQRTLSFKNLTGPIGITRIAYDIARDVPVLILFFGQLSIHLAVVNFLPIPILDGGHMVFLAYEMLLRRKPSEKLVLISNYCGLLVIIGLMVSVIGLDLFRLFHWI